MNGFCPKGLARRFFRRLMGHFTSEPCGGDLGRSAVVFSPHPDDETLGCGGTIIQKRRAGAAVKIVFMTDGGRSHRHLISGDELRSIRASEALAASRTLGVAEDGVTFLGFEDGRLSERQGQAIPRVAEVLRRERPDEVFVPYHRESPPDHFATHRIVLSALRACGRGVAVYEYPIWFWGHWPWVSAPARGPGGMANVSQNSLVSGLRLLRDFRRCVYIGDVLTLKRAALAQHRSQMARLTPDPRWQTLGDVSNGEFLDCFFQDHEVFRHYRLCRARRAGYDRE
ncbi:MAG: LmbE-like protein [Candidatus Handelsmanbacteria bacterium RIFCSPLOWO2_12_FULL_64_10]|uniref:LmbE-like protein n=1 Tax=Handelsmanbacteria sp. (strain RIFCSPLOWO2_12_FULL_64_10) TaxID=1817868 RepID=A0A1F6C5U7_HANXR|nr:MAG: LmbE-like protein [Candidatus Handelsmanbacteria bacterium RIFCSPLOWO2_12_FULL_64_10]